MAKVEEMKIIPRRLGDVTVNGVRRVGTPITRSDYTIVPKVIPEPAIDKALRLLHLEIINWGLPREQIGEWNTKKCWFPTLRWHEDILALLAHVPDQYKEGILCEPQILLHFPDENLDYTLHPHQDEEPPWAKGKKYARIVGIPLTDSTEDNGCLYAYADKEDRNPQPVSLSAGDVLVFSPSLWHSGGLNKTGHIRYVIYFRFLESA